jgi:hypothetical protein
MKKIFIYILFFFIYSSTYFAQTEFKEGKVGYISSQLVYVSFDNTSGFLEGDTLYVSKNSKMHPALVVKYLSSSSAACEKLSNDDFKSGMIILAKNKSEIKIDNSPVSVIPNENINEVKPVQNGESKKPDDQKEIESKISGRYSIQSYSNFNNYNQIGDYQRWRHSFRFGVQNLLPDLSFSTYTIFSYKADDWKNISSNLGRALKVYDLNLNYKFDESTQVWAGRYLNRKISNISIVDGLQFEKAFSFLTVGAVAGSRPNFTDFGWNSKLFEYGIYLNRLDTLGNAMMENTFSLFQQTNNFITDRRFAYLQHINTIIPNTNIFASAEVDLYKKELGKAKSDFSLTSLYLSARYAPVKEFSLNLSYDARKNVYYYETFKSLSDSVLENETRQGFRVRTLIKPFDKLLIGLQFGYRESKSDIKPSKNYGGNISYTQLPLIESSIGFNYNRLQSNYVDGFVYSVTLNKSLAEIKSDFSLSFRKTDYEFLNGTSKFDEKALIIDFSTSLLNPISLSMSYEGVFESVRTYGRLLLDITTRF